MAANQYGIDLAEIYRNKEAVEGARTQNKMSRLKLGKMERLEAERPAKEAAERERKNTLTSLRQKSAGGDTNAQQQLLALDPEGGPKFIDAVSKMDDRQLEATKKTVEEIGQLSGYVLQGGTDQEKQRRYILVRQTISPEMQAKFPEAYDPEFMELSLSRAMTMDKLLENPSVITTGDTGEVWRAGKKVRDFSTGKREDRQSRENIAAKKSSGGSGGEMELKSADENTMYRQSAELLGGMFDQSGNITNLDPSVRNKVQGIASEATKIYRQGGVTRSQAVSQAAKKFGVQVQDAGNMGDNDPLGIR